MHLAFLSLALGAVGALANIVYVTDLGIFTSLAPCAAYAISANVQQQTYSNCPEAVTDLQSCVCTKNNNLASISTGISSSISYSCGGTATDDLASAYTVLSAYCDQSTTASFPAPANPVSAYITDLPAFQDLAPCAASAVSYAVLGMTNDECPEQATLLAPCVCSRNQNSLKASQIINTSVKYSCDSHSADITSAQALFSAYCAMNDGTTKLPTTQMPPGDMTYYITALTDYSSLAPCAQSAISYVASYATYYYCQSGPQALASCMCIKESMSTVVTSSLISNVEYYCDKTASEDVSSALSLFGYYCSAARNEVVAAGITESVAEPSATGSLAGSYTTSGPKATGTNAADSSSGSTRSKTPLIAGAAGAVIAVLAVAGIVAFFILKRRKAANNNGDPNDPHSTGTPLVDHPRPNGGHVHPDEFDGKAELAGTEIKPQGQFGFAAPLPPSSPSPSMIKMGSNRMDNISPVSAHSNMYTVPPSAVEMTGQGAVPPVPPVPELGGGHHSPPPQQGQQYGYQQPQQQPPNGVYEAPNTPQQQPQAMYGQFPQPPAPAMTQGPQYLQQQHQPYSQPQYGTQQPHPNAYGHYPQQYYQGPYNQNPYGQAPPPPPPAELGGYSSPQQFVAELSVDGSRARGLPGANP